MITTYLFFVLLRILWGYIDYCRHNSVYGVGLIGGAFAALPMVIISEDLGNAAHIDEQDIGYSCSLWFEKQLGTAQNWYFLFPHVIAFKDEVKHCGLVIQLFHGCLIS